MLKEKIENILDKIKKSNFVRLIKSKSIIKDLENQIGDLVKEKQALIDKNRILNLENKRFDRHEKKTNEFKKEIKELNNLLETSKKFIKILKDSQSKLECELFETQQEMARYKIQCEEYEHQIENYKTEGRYLIKKVKSGRTPNTIKTKISKPMSGNVVRYMRDEHE